MVRLKLVTAVFFLAGFGIFVPFRFGGVNPSTQVVFGQATPAPDATAFDQKAAIAILREQIKGREQLPAAEVFKNIQTTLLKTRRAGQLLAVMEFGFGRSLGVNCTHCHVPEKWESDEKREKPIAREMSAMVQRINVELLKNIKNLKSESPTVNCTTCHRGEVKPALNLPVPPKV